MPVARPPIPGAREVRKPQLNPVPDRPPRPVSERVEPGRDGGQPPEIRCRERGQCLSGGIGERESGNPDYHARDYIVAQMRSLTLISYVQRKMLRCVCGSEAFAWAAVVKIFTGCS